MPIKKDATAAMMMMTTAPIPPQNQPATAYSQLDREKQEEIKRMAQKVMLSQQKEGQAQATTIAGVQAATQQTETAPSAENQATIDSHAEAFLKMAVAQQVSDIHIRVGYPPVLRRNGDMHYTKMSPVTTEQVFGFMKRFAPADIYAKLSSAMDFDFSFEVANLARFRVNWLHELDRPGLVLRIIKKKIPDFEELGLPEVLLNFTKFNKGLVLVTGPTGSGKTTTLASLINHINRYESAHIITLEDPIEFVYTNEMSVVTQRQLKADTASFPDGIKFALRQDPDVILVGEMRDRETIEAALHAAETGHLVYSTLHTNDAVQTVTRIINQFAPHERESVRLQLAGILKGTVSQRLAKRADGRGRLPIVEVLTVTSTVQDYIERNDIEAIYQLMSQDNNDELVSMNRALFSAYQEGQISYDEALDCSEQPHELALMLRSAYGGGSADSSSMTPMGLE
jgi:twitching motility protein PilT